MRICMITYSFYEYDTRVQQYVDALRQRGDTVDIIALRAEGRPKLNVVDGVNVYGIQTRMRDERGPLTYLWRILRFFCPFDINAFPDAHRAALSINSYSFCSGFSSICRDRPTVIPSSSNSGHTRHSARILF